MKEFIEKIKELKSNDKGKSILFFGFYFLFFIFVFLFIKLTGTKDALLQEYEKGNSSLFNSSILLNNNFYYDYKINLDNNYYNYYGKILGDVESFKYNNSDYYKSNDSYFIDNGTWIMCDNPFVYREFIDTLNISILLDNSYYVSKTDYESGEVDFNYLLSSNTINKLLYDIDSDYDDIPNEIVVKTNNGNITSIVYKLDNYCVSTGKCSNLKIDLSYDLFGEVSKIINPVV